MNSFKLGRDAPDAVLGFVDVLGPRALVPGGRAEEKRLVTAITTNRELTNFGYNPGLATCHET